MFLGFKFHLQQLDEEPVHKICGLCLWVLFCH